MDNLTPGKMFKYGIGLYAVSWAAWFMDIASVAYYADIGARIALVAGVVFLIFPPATGKTDDTQQKVG